MRDNRLFQRLVEDSRWFLKVGEMYGRRRIESVLESHGDLLRARWTSRSLPNRKRDWTLETFVILECQERHSTFEGQAARLLDEWLERAQASLSFRVNSCSRDDGRVCVFSFARARTGDARAEESIISGAADDCASLCASAGGATRTSTRRATRVRSSPRLRPESKDIYIYINLKIRPKIRSHCGPRFPQVRGAQGDFEPRGLPQRARAPRRPREGRRVFVVSFSVTSVVSSRIWAIDRSNAPEHVSCGSSEHSPSSSPDTISIILETPNVEFSIDTARSREAAALVFAFETRISVVSGPIRTIERSNVLEHVFCGS